MCHPLHSADLSDGVDNVVDFEYGSDGLRGQGDGACGNEEGLDDILLQDVGDCSLAHIDPAVDFSLGVLVPQLSDGADRVKASVLGQGVGNDFESLGESLEAVGVGTDQGVGVLHELEEQLRFGGSTAGDQESLLHQASDDTEGVMQRSIGLLKDQLVGSSHDDANGSTLIVDARKLNEL